MAEESLTRNEEPSSAHAPAEDQSSWSCRVKNYKADAGQVEDKDRETTVKIPKVSWNVRKKACYEPEIVSIGPYHYLQKKPELQKFQDIKVRLANTFVKETKGSPSLWVDELRGKVSKVAGEARKCYSGDALGGMTDEEFTDVMFLDGCFVLDFISTWGPAGNNFTKHLQLNANEIRLVVRDLFLLDNQVPFMVLEALSPDNTLIESVSDFLKAYSFPGNPAGIGYRKFKNGTDPIHLLDFLSLCLYDPGDAYSRLRNRPKGEVLLRGEWLTCPGVTRLEEAGIDCWPTKSRRTTAICFTPKLFTAELRIPPVFIGEHSMTYWVNLAAYQQIDAGGGCGGGGGGGGKGARGNGAAEYIWMLGKLIDSVEDMKKLRAKQIIFHDFEDDQKLVDVLKDTSKNISNDYLGMTGGLPIALGNERVLVQQIQDHMRSKYRMWFYKTIYLPYFRSPWSVPAFLAAVIGLILTFLQVYYTIYPR